MCDVWLTRVRALPSCTEDSILVRNQAALGNKWSEIARLLPGRSENAVKNRFNSINSKLRAGEDTVFQSDEKGATCPVAYNVVALPKDGTGQTLADPPMSKSASGSSVRSEESEGSPQPPKGKKGGSRATKKGKVTSRGAKLIAKAAENPDAPSPQPASGKEIISSIFSTLGKFLPNIHGPGDFDDYDEEEDWGEDDFEVDAEGNPVLTIPENNLASLGLDLGIANSFDLDGVADEFEGSGAEMKAMLMTKAAIDKEVAREKLFSEVMVNPTIDDVAPPKVAKQQEASVRIGSNLAENAVYNDFLMDGPEVSIDLGASYGAMSLCESASLNLSAVDVDKSVALSVATLDVGEKSIQGEGSWEVKEMGRCSLEIDTSSPPALGGGEDEQSPRVPSDDCSGSVNTNRLSIPTTPLGFSDASLGDLLKASTESSVKSSASGKSGGSSGKKRTSKKKATMMKNMDNNLTPLERLLKKAEVNSERYEPTPLKQMQIKGRLGGSRKKRGKIGEDDGDWEKFLVKEDKEEEKKVDEATEGVKKTATMFGDAAIEAAIAGVNVKASELQVDISQRETPPPSDEADEKVWPGVMAFCYNNEEGGTQRLAKKDGLKRSRPASRDSLGSSGYGKLSVVSSIADLTVDRMSLTNSVKSLSLDDGEWAPPGGVGGGGELNMQMQMSELMRIGWELREDAGGGGAVAGGKGVGQSRGSSADSRTGLERTLGLSLGVKGLEKARGVKTVETMDVDTSWIAPVKPKGARKAGGTGGRGAGGGERKKKEKEKKLGGGRESGGKSPVKRAKKFMDEEREKERSGSFIAPQRPTGGRGGAAGGVGGGRHYVRLDGSAPRARQEEPEDSGNSWMEETSAMRRGSFNRGGSRIVLNIE